MIKNQIKFFLLLTLVFTVLFVPLGLAEVKDTASDVAEAFEEGDIEGTASHAGQLFGELSDSLQIVRYAMVLLGVIVIALIVLRLSKMLSRPKADKKKIQKEKEDAEFKKMFSKKELSLDDLKKQLTFGGKENKGKKR